MAIPPYQPVIPDPINSPTPGTPSTPGAFSPFDYTNYFSKPRKIPMGVDPVTGLPVTRDAPNFLAGRRGVDAEGNLTRTKEPSPLSQLPSWLQSLFQGLTPQPSPQMGINPPQPDYPLLRGLLQGAPSGQYTLPVERPTDLATLGGGGGNATSAPASVAGMYPTGSGGSTGGGSVAPAASAPPLSLTRMFGGR